MDSIRDAVQESWPRPNAARPAWRGLRLNSTHPLPKGAVTFLLTDVEGSTRLWERCPDTMPAAIARHEAILVAAIDGHGGVRPVEQGEGDSMVGAFAHPSDALAAALDAQRGLAAERWPEGIELRVRMAIHTGEPSVAADGRYAGQPLNRSARLRELAHGGQVVLSRTTHDMVVGMLPGDAALRDLGAHRLRDLERAEHVYQLCHPDLPDDFPPLRSVDAIPNNLPVQLTSFIGREQELTQVVDLVQESRLITLTGSGGCGKTRLALESAATLIDSFADGTFLVDLAPIRDPDVVPRQVAAAIAAQETPNEPLVETLVRVLRDQHVLLILDNCEHVVEACASLVDELLRKTKGVAILATSREPLGVGGETAWRVPSLSHPDDPTSAEALPEYEAVRLFLDRAAKVRPNFALTSENASHVADICRKLDGIPLAIELAAARVRVLSLERIARGLEDRFRLLTGGSRTAMPRQQTLEASVEWSFDLLEDEERIVLRRLSVFAGGFDLEGAEAVCADDGIEPDAVLDVLTRLVDRSLVQVEQHGSDVRYRLLETIRQFAARLLTSGKEAAATRTRHLDHMITLAEGAELGCEGPDIEQWLERVEIERDNIRAAMDWSVACEDTNRALRLVGALMLPWTIRWHVAEGKSRLDEALALQGADPRWRAKALMASLVLWDFDRMDTDLSELEEEALHLAREAGDDRTLGRALIHVAWRHGSRTIETLPMLDEAMEAAQRANDGWGIVQGHVCRSHMLLVAGDLRGARTEAEQGLEIARALGAEQNIGECLYMQSTIEANVGDLDAAVEDIDRAISICERLRDRLRLYTYLHLRAAIRRIRGDAHAARADVERALALAAEIGTSDHSARDVALRLDLDAGGVDAMSAYTGPMSINLIEDFARAGDLARVREAAENVERRGRDGGSTYVELIGRFALALLARREGRLADAYAVALEVLQFRHGAGYALDSIEPLELLGGIAVDSGDGAAAARLLAAAQAARETMGAVRSPVLEQQYRADVEAARALVSDEAVWKDGERMSLDEAVAYASRGRGPRGRPAAGWASLTPAELEVVRLTAQGLTNAQIADRLFVTPGTVKVHLAHVFAKLGISTRTELAAESIRRGIA